MKQRQLSELFISYGAGAHYFQSLTRAKAWNLISWILIVVGAFGWVIFLMWKPLA